MEDERALGLRAHDSVDCRQLADRISRRQHCRAPSARVTISRVGRIEFVRTADPLDVWIAIDCVTNRKGIVTRYAETVFDALISNSLDDIVNYRCRFCSHHFFLKLSETGISHNVKSLRDSWARPRKTVPRRGAFFPYLAMILDRPVRHRTDSPW